MPRPRVTLVASSPAPARPSPQTRGFAAPPQGGRGRGRAAARRASGPLAWRADFARIWQLFLLDHYGADPHAVAAEFDVRVQTARNWLQGLHKPTGDVVAWAMLRWRAEITAAALRVGVA